MFYDKIYEFCRAKNIGGAHKNGNSPPPRVLWILDLLNSNNIDYILDEFEDSSFPDNKFYNIFLPGTSLIAVSAHHDIVNPLSDNANDNSASVINAISLKVISPETSIILLDGEEPPMMGVGSRRASKKILSGEYPNIKSVLNFELTGRGGKNFFIGNTGGDLSDKINSIFSPPNISTPFNDSDIFRECGIDSVVINPLPETLNESRVKYSGKNLDFSIVYNCHSLKDNINSIDPKDMKEFVEEVVVKIVK